MFDPRPKTWHIAQTTQYQQSTPASRSARTKTRRGRSVVQTPPRLVHKPHRPQRRFAEEEDGEAGNEANARGRQADESRRGKIACGGKHIQRRNERQIARFLVASEHGRRAHPNVGSGLYILRRLRVNSAEGRQGYVRAPQTRDQEVIPQQRLRTKKKTQAHAFSVRSKPSFCSIPSSFSQPQRPQTTSPTSYPGARGTIAERLEVVRGWDRALEEGTDSEDVEGCRPTSRSMHLGVAHSFSGAGAYSESPLPQASVLTNHLYAIDIRAARLDARLDRVYPAQDAAWKTSEAE
ncbi:hypothetical protein DFH09DRAFT_1106533 [Mycena vulgaris]|nr:hypothetical protein DFH09DRAFT_1106533 [Mycena vulgaris]